MAEQSSAFDLEPLAMQLAADAMLGLTVLRRYASGPSGHIQGISLESTSYIVFFSTILVVQI